MAINRQVVTGSTIDSSQNVGTLSLRQRQLDFLPRSGRVDGFTHLVLLLEHIDLFTSGSNEDPLLHGNGELGLTCNELGNSTLVEDVVHHDILMNGEGHTNDGVHSSQIGALPNALHIIHKQLSGIILCRLNQSSSISGVSLSELVRIAALADEEILQSITGGANIQSLIGLSKQIHAFIQNILSTLNKGLGIASDRIISITIAHRVRSTITNNRHKFVSSFLIFKVNFILLNMPL